MSVNGASTIVGRVSWVIWGSEGSNIVINKLLAAYIAKKAEETIPTSAKNISVRAEWLRRSGRALSEPSETPWWQITPRPASIQRVAFHIAL